MMFYLMFQSLNLVLALVHLLFLPLNFEIACLMICVPVFLLSALNQNLRHTYFVKPSVSVSVFFIILVLSSIFPSSVVSLFPVVVVLSWGDSLISLVRLLSRRWNTLMLNSGVIASLAWSGSCLRDGIL